MNVYIVYVHTTRYQSPYYLYVMMLESMYKAWNAYTFINILTNILYANHVYALYIYVYTYLAPTVFVNIAWFVNGGGRLQW